MKGRHRLAVVVVVVDVARRAQNHEQARAVLSEARAATQRVDELSERAQHRAALRRRAATCAQRVHLERVPEAQHDAEEAVRAAQLEQLPEKRQRGRLLLAAAAAAAAMRISLIAQRY